MSTAVKICGITRREDAEKAVELGATHIGLIFVDSSPRRMRPDVAREIACAVRGRATVVGVFKDPAAELVDQLFNDVGLDMVQYHGDESAQFVRALGLPAIKAFLLDREFQWESVRPYEGTIKAMLIDKPKGVNDEGWLQSALVVTAKRPDNLPPLFFAGGLSADNVSSIIRLIKPFGVDVASGVERKPGVKDHDKLKRFFLAVNEESSRCGH